MVVGVTTVKDELDVLPFTLPHMLDQLDMVVVVDNGSTDGTRDYLADLARQEWERLHVEDEPEVGYYQAQRMTRLAGFAAELGAAWVVPFDADEWWYTPHARRIADVLGDQPAAISEAALYDHVATGKDPADSDPTSRIGWRRRDPAPLPKVAARTRVPVAIEQGNHGAGYPAEREAGLLVIRHFPYRSVEQMIRKARNGARAYAATDLPDHVGQHWRDYGRLSDEQIGDVFREHFWTAAPDRDPALIFDPAPRP